MQHDLGALRRPPEQRRQHEARDGERAGRPGRRPATSDSTIGSERRMLQIRLQRQHDDGEHVLHQQDAERQPAVDGVELALVGEQLDHDHRARERRGDAEVERRQAVEAEQAHGARRRSARRARPGTIATGAPTRPELTSFLRSISRPTMNIRKRQAELGELGDRASRCGRCRGRADRSAGRRRCRRGAAAGAAARAT